MQTSIVINPGEDISEVLIALCDITKDQFPELDFSEHVFSGSSKKSNGWTFTISEEFRPVACIIFVL